MEEAKQLWPVPGVNKKYSETTSEEAEGEDYRRAACIDLQDKTMGELLHLV